MSARRRIKRVLYWALAATAACAIAVGVFRDAIAAYAIETIAGGMTHLRVTVRDVDVGWGRASVDGFEMRTAAGEPVAEIDTIRAGYGFDGFESISAERPRFVLIRHRDGTFNVPLPSLHGGSAGSTRMHLTAAVRDGSILIVDQGARDAAARRLAVEHVTFDAAIDTQAVTRYAFSADYAENGRAFPIRAHGTIDAARATMLHRLTIAKLPVARLVNFAANTRALSMRSGELDGVEATVAGLPGANGAMDVHVGGSARLRGGTIASPALGTPLSNVRGRFDLYENGLLTDGLDADLGSTVVRASGGVFDLQHPQIRIAVTSAAAAQPLLGRIDVALLAAGRNAAPFVVASLRSPGLSYGAARAERPELLAVADAHGVDLLGARATVAQVPYFAAGRIAFAANGPRAPEIGLLGASADGGRLEISRALGETAPLSIAAQLPALDANATLAYENDVLRVTNAVAAAGPLTLVAGGRIERFSSSSRRYDLGAHVVALDLHDVAAIARPDVARAVEGSLDADVRVSGSGASPRVAGTLDVPEGSVNGEAFRDLSASIEGGPAAVALTNGGVDVGSTHVAFGAGAAPGAVSLEANAPRANLADFNDLFDRGDVLAGTGSVSAAFADDGGTLATSGSASLRDARVSGFPLGTAAGTWRTQGRAVAMNLGFSSAAGRARVRGSVAFPSVDLDVTARDFDVATWLPPMGIELTATGRVDADVRARGTYPALQLALRGDARDATVRGIPVQRLTFAAHSDGTRGTIDSAMLQLPYLTADAGGTFGLGSGDPLDLHVHATSTDVGALAKELQGRPFDASGSLDTTLAIGGTPARPEFEDRLTLSQLRYGETTVPRISADVAFDARRATLREGEADLQRGRLFASGTLPIALAPEPRVAGGPIAADLRFDDVELSNLAGALPPKTEVQGRIDGTVSLHGTMHDPLLGGSLALSGGSFSGPQEEVPITAAAAKLALQGTRIALQEARANVGGGTMSATATAALPSLAALESATINAHLTADRAVVDLPAYYKGQIDAALSLERVPGALPKLSGNVALSHARLPAAAFVSAAGAPAERDPLDAAFDLGVDVGRDVRVQSPNVDVGGTGSLHLGGTLLAPQIGGRIESTGGTVSFYRDFRIERGEASFDPSGGLTPNVRAVADTTISDPPTQISIDVRGPADDMNVAFSSEPSYDRGQILALLTGTEGGGAPPSLRGEAQNLALGQINGVFTRELLEPLSANLGSALGLANLDVYNDLGEGFGFGANAKIGQRMTATGSESFGFPRREEIDLGYRSGSDASVRLNVYQQQVLLFGELSSVATVGNQSFDVVSGSAAVPVAGGGTSGVELSIARRYW